MVWEVTSNFFGQKGYIHTKKGFGKLVKTVIKAKRINIVEIVLREQYKNSLANKEKHVIL
jgi:hypothetical protein